MPKPVIFAIGPEHLERESLTETVLPREDGQRAATQRGAFEWWYFDAHFDDHTTAVIVYATKPIINPAAPLTPNLSLTITRADGAKTAEFALPPADQFSASSELCDVRIGASWVKQISFGTQLGAQPATRLGAQPLQGATIANATHLGAQPLQGATNANATRLGAQPLQGATNANATRLGAQPLQGATIANATCWNYSLHAETNGLAADLTFSGLVPPWRPGAGKSFFGDLEHYFAWLPSIPYGAVEGTLTYDGQTHAVCGSGYHDHNWGNVALPSVMDHWYWGRAHIGDYTLIFVEQIALKKYGSTRMPVFLLAKGEKVLVDDGRYLTMQARVYTRHPGGREVPREVDFTWTRAQDQVRLELRKQKLIEGTSLLLALPPKKRALARLFANPYYFRFNTELDLKIDLGDLHDTIRGPALYEIMMLR